MGITLFISEKPSLGKTVAKALGVKKEAKTHIECDNNCVVTFAEGHLYEFLEPHEYNAKFKYWRREDLPLPIPHLKLKAQERTSYRLDVIHRYLKTADVVVHVGDPDREGQRIVDDILQEAGYKGKVKRLWNTDQSERGMKQTIDEFKKGFPENSEPRFQNRGEAARARAELDWRLGINVSRALGVKLQNAGIHKVVSYGRFQTTVLAIIVARENERRNFKPKTFYTPQALINGVLTSFIHDTHTFPDGYDSENYLVSKETALKICSLVANKEGVVVQCDVNKKTESPPLPYDITKLIQDANRIYKLTAKEVNDIAQSLYDQGITTYPRVDCRFLPEAHHEEASRILAALKGLPGADMAKPSIKGKAFNTAKTDEAAHHAIVPTGDAWQKLSGNELKVFKLIAQGYILQFLPDREYQSQTLVVAFDGPPKTEWKATGVKTLVPGFKAILEKAPSEEEEENGESGELPVFKKGESVFCDKTSLKEGQTKIPPAFTEGSIMLAMENVDKFEPNKEYKKLLKDAKGIGTGATRGGILELLKKRDYITVTKGVIAPTEYGENLVSWVPESLKSPALTAIMEGDLEEIVQGRLKRADLLEKVNTSIPGYLEAVDMVEIEAEGELVCPVCTTSIVVRYPSKKEEGTFYWRCKNEQCGKFYPDNNGKPGFPLECPACGEKTLTRHESKQKKGNFFWACSNEACKKFFNDEKGKPVLPVACPACGKKACSRFESQKKPGTFYWKCKDCGKGFTDDKKKPGAPFQDYADQKKDVCPVCQNECVQLTSRKGFIFWACQADKQHIFADENDTPGRQLEFGEKTPPIGDGVKCPHCKKKKAFKFESRKKAGVFYWKCESCGNMKDEDGKPGKKFDA